MTPRGRRFASIAIALALVAVGCFQSPPNIASPVLQSGRAAGNPATGLLMPPLTKVPMFFVENRGQAGPAVDYYLQSADASVGFSDQGVQMTLMENQSPTWDLRLEFPGARSVSPEAQAPTKTVVSYFQDQQSGLGTYSRIVYNDLWPGIDLIYRISESRLKYEFLVAPGADPGVIRLRWNGAESLSLNEDGSLKIATPVRDLTDPSPTTYQTIAGERVVVASAYQLDKNKEVRFSLGRYDRTKPVVIDPVIFQSAGYLGGVGNGFDVALDTQGNIYVAGQTASLEEAFVDGGIGARPSFDRTNGGNWDAFVAKLNPHGTELLYAGFLGGTEPEEGLSLAVDAAGAVYLTGTTESSEATFPDGDGFGSLVRPDHGFDGPFQSRISAFVVKINPAGTALEYAGYIGDSFGRGTGIAVDSAGAAYVVGEGAKAISSTMYDGATHLNGQGSAGQPGLNGFAVKVSPEGGRFEYVGFLAGLANGVAVDSSGAAHVAGNTLSPASVFPDGDGMGTLVAADGSHNSPTENDAYYARIAPDGASVTAATYIGGSQNDEGNAISLDPGANVYVAGNTSSEHTSFPNGSGMGTLPGFDRTSNGESDAFVVKVNAGGGSFGYAGYVGGAGGDTGEAVAVDAAGAAHLAGTTTSTQATFPDGNGFGLLPGPDRTANGGAFPYPDTPPDDTFVVKVTPSGTALAFGTYVGGNGPDQAKGVAVNNAGDVLVTGMSGSEDTTFPDGDGFGALPGADQTRELGGWGFNAFLVKMGTGPIPPPGPSPSPPPVPLPPVVNDALAWGWNGVGMLGTGNLTDKPSPVPAIGLSDVTQISAGYLHSAALKKDGTVWAWGWNALGMLGDDTTTDRLAPVQVPGLTDVVSVAAGYYHTLATKSDGSVWAWGWNPFGQLGDGTTTDRHRPVRVNNLTNVASVSAGPYQSIALKKDGTAWAWGWNGYNQLGDGTATQRNSPVRVVGLKNITGISAGALHGLASDITGRVWAWGWNGVGQLGDGSATSHPLPGLVPGLQGIKKVSAGFAHSLAVGQDGRLHSWGWNIFGQLGDGTGLDRYRPVVTGTGMQDASAGVLHSLGVKNDEVYGWGWNGLGTVGDGSTTDRRVPTRVLNTHVTYVAAGAYHSLASGDPAP